MLWVFVGSDRDLVWVQQGSLCYGYLWALTGILLGCSRVVYARGICELRQGSCWGAAG